MTTTEPALFASLRRRRFYRSLGVVLVVMATVPTAVNLADVEGWHLVELLAALTVLVVVLAAGWAHQREAQALERLRAARPNAWIRTAAVYGLPQHVVVAVEGDVISVIDYDGTVVATWERDEMAAVGIISLPSHWPERPGVVLHFDDPQVPTLLITFTAHAGLTAPPDAAAEAAQVLDPGLSRW